MPNTKGSAHKSLPAAIARSLASTVRSTRETAAMTQEDVAAAAGVSVQMVRRLEAGTGNPTLGTLHAVAGALGTDLIGLLRPNR